MVCFQSSAIVNRSAMCVFKSLCGHTSSAPLGRNLRVAWLGHTVSVCNFVKRKKNCSPELFYHSPRLPAVLSVPTVPHPPQHLGLSVILILAKQVSAFQHLLNATMSQALRQWKTPFLPSRADILVGKKTHKYFLIGCVRALKETGQVH